ncbi:MAG: hypothetical protein N2378_02615 [Chloroflexaceae bacterium]|nr:hypothetical protein [Chloroflexaceae bacterium]
MGQPAGSWEVTIEISWRRLLAGLLVLAGLAVLGFGVFRPLFSAYLGRQISREINEAVAREVLVALVGEPTAPAADPPVAPAASDERAAPTAAPSVAPGAPLPEAASAAPTEASPGAPSAVAAATPAPVDSRSILRAVVAPVAPTAAALATAERAAAPVDAPGAAPTSEAPSTPPATPPTTAPEAPRSVEEVVAALPSGTITVTEEKLNRRIAERIAGRRPIDGITVRFVPEQVQVTLTVLGQDTLATSELALVDGRVVARNPQLSGPLGMVIAVNELVRPVEDELNRILASAERAVRAVRIEQGQIVVTLD